jgi:hypothetical protein
MKKIAPVRSITREWGPVFMINLNYGAVKGLWFIVKGGMHIWIMKMKMGPAINVKYEAVRGPRGFPWWGLFRKSLSSSISQRDVRHGPDRFFPGPLPLLQLWLSLAINQGIKANSLSRHTSLVLHSTLIYNIDYRCEDRKKVGELRGDTGAIL